MKKQTNKAAEQLQLYSTFVNGQKVIVAVVSEKEANLIFDDLRNGKGLKKQD